MVALRKESVDRNVYELVERNPNKFVALRKESVDRNTVRLENEDVLLQSLSARRAWIEICLEARKWN